MDDYKRIGSLPATVTGESEQGYPIFTGGAELFVHVPTGVVVTDIEAHAASLTAVPAKQRNKPCPACGNWRLTGNNQCYGCRKPFMQCDCRGSNR